MKQFDIYIANLNPTVGTEINKTRPVVIVSPDEMNDFLNTVIVAPVTSQIHSRIPTRIEIEVENKINYVVIDQLRTLDKTRLFKYIGNLSKKESGCVKDTILEMFS